MFNFAKRSLSHIPEGITSKKFSRNKYPDPSFLIFSYIQPTFMNKSQPIVFAPLQIPNCYRTVFHTTTKQPPCASFPHEQEAFLIKFLFISMTLVQGSLALPSSNARTNNWPENTNNKQHNLPLSLELN